MAEFEIIALTLSLILGLSMAQMGRGAPPDPKEDEHP